MTDRKYINFDPPAGFPAGASIRYECGICADSLPSMPQHAVACKCRNIVVDVDAGRVSVKNLEQMKAYEITS
jgi:hypothetical protein